MKITVGTDGYIKDISKSISPDIAFGCSMDFFKFSENSSDIFFSEITKIVEKEKNLKNWMEVALLRLFKNKKLLFKPLNITTEPWVKVDNYDDVLLGYRKFSKFDDAIKDISIIYFLI